jgi:predicted RNase H-like HicB family nuclease
MKLKVIVHDEDGGYWAQVPALPGCATEGDTMEELLANVKEAIKGWLEAAELPALDEKSRVLEIAL